MAQQEEINFPFKARYFQLGTVHSKTKNIWFVLHGYGQLAEFFIRKFKVLENDETCIIAPEGLSRFYLTDNSGRVGATWMTKENRLMDIENYIQYLNSIYDLVLRSVNPPKITILGFSQGAATASRWTLSRQNLAQRLILWAGIFPPDLDIEKGSEILNAMDVIEVYGTTDPYLTDDKFKEMISLNTKLKLSATVIRFEGGHEMDEKTLQQLA